MEAAKKAALTQPQTTSTSQASAPPKRKLVTQPRTRSKRARGPEASAEVDLTDGDGREAADTNAALTQTLMQQVLAGKQLSATHMQFLMLQQMSSVPALMSSLMERSLERPSSSSSDKTAKQKALEKDMKPVYYDEMVELKDNGVDEVDMELRHKLRTPNANPEKWWSLEGKDIEFFDKSLPVRGTSLHLEPQAGSNRANEDTLIKLHKRSSSINLKMLLTKNQFVTDKNKSLLYDRDSESFTSGYKWQEASTVWEIIDAVHNLVNSIMMIRAYSYEATALSRGLHQVR